MMSLESKRTFLAIWDGEVVGSHTGRHLRYAIIIQKCDDRHPRVGGFTRTRDSAARLVEAFGPQHKVLGIVELQQHGLRSDLSKHEGMMTPREERDMPYVVALTAVAAALMVAVAVLWR
jgi:hypothetical protein